MGDVLSLPLGQADSMPCAGSPSRGRFVNDCSSPAAFVVTGQVVRSVGPHTGEIVTVVMGACSRHVMELADWSAGPGRDLADIWAIAAWPRIREEFGQAFPDAEVVLRAAS
jgi:hypothetical protein